MSLTVTVPRPAPVTSGAWHGRGRVYWRGAPDARVERAVAASAASGLTVAVHRSAFSAAELDAARSQVTASRSAVDELIGVRPDGSGLTIGVPTAADVSALRAHLFADPIRIERGGTAVLVPVDVTVEQYHPARVRDWYTRPVRGGLSLNRGAGVTGMCSSGFWVKKDGQDRLMTAAHCFKVGQVVKDRNYEKVGTVNERGDRFDAEYIRPATNAAVRLSPSVWANDDPTSALAAAVTGVDTNHVGDRVFNLGYSSMATAGTIDQLGILTRRASGHVYLVDQATSTDGALAAEGDSGGPVASLSRSADGRSATVRARGIVAGTGAESGGCVNYHHLQLVTESR